MPKALIAAFLSILSWNLEAQHYAPKDSIDFYVQRSLFIKALKNSKTLSKHYIKTKNYRAFADNVVKQSNIYHTLNDNRKAISVAYDGLDSVRAHARSDSSAQIVLLRQIGIIYVLRQDYYPAIRKYNLALRLAERNRDEKLTGLMYQSLYSAHAKCKSDSAYYYLQKTVQYNKKINTPQSLFSAYNNSYYYFIDRNIEKAQNYLDSAIFQARKTGDKAILKLALNNLGGLYYKKGDFKSAKKAYLETLSILPNDTLSMTAGDLYYTYSGVLYNLKDFKGAYEYSDRAIDVRDANYSAEMTSAVRDIEIKYQLQQLEEKQERQTQREREGNLREKRILSIIIAVALITIILLYFFYQNNRLKQKNKLSEIESETQQKLLSATLDAREIERRHIASVLHDNVSAMLSSAGLQLTAFSAAQGNNDEIAKARKILNEAHDKVRDLSHELVPTLLAKFGLAYALDDLCEKFSTPALALHYADDGSVKRYAEDLEIKIYFIASELLNNVLKHSSATKAELRLSASSSLEMALEDNGKGFDTSKPDGFGLTQIKARVAALNGKFSIVSKPNAGTLVKIELPLP